MGHLPSGAVWRGLAQNCAEAGLQERMGQEDGKMKAEPAAGVWGRRIAGFSQPAALPHGWLQSRQSSQFRRSMSQQLYRIA